MSFQFVRLETFSRKGNSARRSVAAICQEADRDPGSCPHVQNPEPPEVLDGVHPREVPQLIEDQIADRGKIKGRGRPIRSDTHVLEGQVHSHPFRVEDLKDPEKKKAYEAWEKDTIAHAKRDAEARGVKIVSIVRHLDESHPHLHMLGIPQNERIDAKLTHPGEAAKKTVEKDKSPKEVVKQQSDAYNKAMRAWLDSYHDNVGQYHGQLRFGPGKRRLSRGAHNQEKANAALLAERHQKIKSKEAEIIKEEKQLSHGNKELRINIMVARANIMGEAEAIMKGALAEKTRLLEAAQRDAQEAAKRALDAANAELAPIRQATADAYQRASQALSEANREADRVKTTAKDEVQAEIKELTKKATRLKAKVVEAEKYESTCRIDGDKYLNEKKDEANKLKEEADKTLQAAKEKDAAWTAANQNKAKALEYSIKLFAEDKIIPLPIGQDRKKNFYFNMTEEEKAITKPIVATVWDQAHDWMRKQVENLRPIKDQIATATKQLQETAEILKEALELKIYLPAAQAAKTAALAEQAKNQQERLRQQQAQQATKKSVHTL